LNRLLPSTDPAIILARVASCEPGVLRERTEKELPICVKFHNQWQFDFCGVRTRPTAGDEQ
jgi:hypothetical protein